MLSVHKKRIILLCLAVVIVAIATAAAMIWNKPHKKAEDEAGIPVAAAALFHEFSTGEQTANAKYLNKVLEVSGTVTEVSKNQDGKTVVILQADDPLGGVQCTMREDGVALSKDQQVKVKGFCNGYTMVVLLSDCVLQK